MVVSEVIGVSTDVISEIGKIGLFLQTLGIVVLLTVIINVALLFIHRKRLKAVLKIKEEVERVEKKVDILTREVRKNIKKKL
ncbi:MAG: hypothetical protein PF542_06760 [Nanoarchaeota archaeon]|jgi:uncharacterized protein Yka (UPF0111/DUF47 family)|nr:hypothetical protein [Nanoarchaeota archaeon]